MIASLIAGIATRTGLGAGLIKILGATLIVAAVIVGWHLFLTDVRHDAVAEATAQGEATFQTQRADAVEDAWIAADERAAAHANAQALDMQRIQDAKDDGTSPFDALFPRD